jgi:hypothetical protein
MKSYHEMTREELWEEFENQLIRETRISMTMSFDEVERATILGIKETVAKWKDRLEQEPCEDAVSRKGVVEYIKTSDAELGHDSENELVVKDILNMPSVTPTRKKGYWEQYGDFWKEKFRCSECGKEQPKILCGEQIIGHWSDYCPNCGAEMESEK